MRRSELRKIIAEEVKAVMLEENVTDVYLQKARARLDTLKQPAAGNTEQEKNLNRFSAIFDTVNIILMALEDLQPMGKGEQ